MQHKIVSRDEWLAARKAHLAGGEGAHPAARPARAAAPRAALGEGREGVRLRRPRRHGNACRPVRRTQPADRPALHARRRGWKEGCVGCSFAADHIDGALVHLEHHDVTFVAVSRAPLAEIEPYQQRMGWRFKWVSSYGSDFNYDYHVSFTPEDVAAGQGLLQLRCARSPDATSSPGLSVFYKDATGDVFHTYSTYARGGRADRHHYMLLDMTPKGRNETGPRLQPDRLGAPPRRVR